MHRVKASIDLTALRHNFSIAHASANASRVVAIIKANAYGHGLVQTAQALTDADLYGVTDVHEALSLKQALRHQNKNNDKPILVLQGLIQEDDLLAVAEHNFQLVVHCLSQLKLIDETLSKLSLKEPLTFWLKMDSGMGRLGLYPNDIVSSYQTLQGKPYTRKVILMTHLANSSIPNSALNNQQLNSFRDAETELTQHINNTPLTSIPSSSGILSELPLACDYARPGIMLYGSSPFAYKDEHLRREQFNLKAVMTLQARLIAIKELKQGDNVGYCSQYICPKNMRLGIVSIGYADGYPSNAPNNTPVSVAGIRTGTVGRVSMDMLGIDLSDIPEANVGDPVTLWGQDISLDEIAAKTGILSYNLTCSISRRVEFSYQ